MAAFFDSVIQLSSWLFSFTARVARRFMSDDCLESAAFLWFSSMLALVPLTAVVFSIFSIFPLFGEWKGTIESFIFTNFVPASGEVIREYTASFVDQTRKMTLAGTLFLFVTSIMLMSSIERIFNRIWRARSNRTWSKRLVVYWSSLTLGPLILGASLGLSSYLLTVSLISDAVVGLGGVNNLLKLAPVFAAFVGIMMMYLIVPNHRVRVKYAAVGAAVAALLFEFAKYGFVAYVTYFPTYQKIYGALAVIPIFMLWAYLSWVVVLIGASVASALETSGRATAHDDVGPVSVAYHAYRILGRLFQAQHLGNALTLEDLHSCESDLQKEILAEALALMLGKKWIAEIENEGWMLRRNLNDTTVGDFFSLLEHPVVTTPEAEDRSMADAWDLEWYRAREAGQEQLGSSHNVPLAEMYQDQKLAK